MSFFYQNVPQYQFHYSYSASGLRDRGDGVMELANPNSYGNALGIKPRVYSNSSQSSSPYYGICLGSSYGSGQQRVGYTPQGQMVYYS